MKLCVALDMEDKKSNFELIKKLKGLDVWLKVGLRSFIRDGKEFVDAIKVIDSDMKIFLDLKLYDIPNTMADAAESIMDLGIDMFNIHASAGEEAMNAVMQRVSGAKKRPLVLAVTALTSFDEASFSKIYNQEIKRKSTEFAKQSYDCGLDGVVCSIWESAGIKDFTDRNFLTLTPGIRPFGEETNDQKRVANLKDAKDEKSDFLVVGRPIYRSDDPRGVTQKILSQMNN